MKALIRLLRPKHWVKNLFVLAPLAFSGRFNEMDSNMRTLFAFIAFCLLASATYVLNDIFDVEADRAHPTKSKTRPIAAGQITVRSAWVVFAVLIAATVAVVWSLPKLAIIAGCYISLQLAYNFYLKRQPVLELFALAAGFVLRVYAGAYSIEVRVSMWMFVTTFCLAIFLAAVKRFQEAKTHGDSSRKVLAAYPIPFIQRIAEMTGTLAVVFYSLFVLSARPAFIYTVPVVIFVLVRYWFVADKAGAGESPTDLILRDRQLLIAAGILVAIFAVVLSVGVKG